VTDKVPVSGSAHGNGDFRTTKQENFANNIRSARSESKNENVRLQRTDFSDE